MGRDTDLLSWYSFHFSSAVWRKWVRLTSSSSWKFCYSAQLRLRHPGGKWRNENWYPETCGERTYLMLWPKRGSPEQSAWAVAPDCVCVCARESVRALYWTVLPCVVFSHCSVHWRWFLKATLPDCAVFGSNLYVSVFFCACLFW